MKFEIKKTLRFKYRKKRKDCMKKQIPKKKENLKRNMRKNLN